MFCVVVEQVSEVGDGQFLEGFECEEVVFKLYVLRNRQLVVFLKDNCDVGWEEGGGALDELEFTHVLDDIMDKGFSR